jgi:hypothetical protein
VRLLLRFPAAACSGVVERGSAPLVQYHAGGVGVDNLEQTGLSEGVWEVAGSEVLLFV